MHCAIALVAVSMVTGQVQEPQSNYKHLKSFDALIGTWSHEGSILNDVPVAEKGTKLEVEWSWRWILNKSVVETVWEIEWEGGVETEGKSLIGWDLAENRAISGLMASPGGHTLATIAIDENMKTWTFDHEGVNADGKKTSNTQIIELKGPDSFMLHFKSQRVGDKRLDDVVYEFKRCPQDDDDDDDD